MMIFLAIGRWPVGKLVPPHAASLPAPLIRGAFMILGTSAVVAAVEMLHIVLKSDDLCVHDAAMGTKLHPINDGSS